MGFKDREASRKSADAVKTLISKKTPGKKKGGKKQPISLTVDPVLYESIKRIAFVKRMKVSEIFDEFIENYVNEHQAELEEYEALNK